MAQHRTDAERRREVEGWRSSGEGVGKYAARRGYSATTLRKWIASVGSEAGAAKAAKAKAPALVRVVAQSAAEAAEAAEVVVEVGAARIRVPRAFDAALLRSVVIALSERAS
jgi:transposase-like protein